MAERLVALLAAEQIEAMSRAGGAASSAAFAATEGTYWDLLVDEAQLAKAQALVQAELAALEKEGDANARAAEEEALSGENPVG